MNAANTFESLRGVRAKRGLWRNVRPALHFNCMVLRNRLLVGFAKLNMCNAILARPRSLWDHKGKQEMHLSRLTFTCQLVSGLSFWKRFLSRLSRLRSRRFQKQKKSTRRERNSERMRKIRSQGSRLPPGTLLFLPRPLDLSARKWK